MTGIGPIRFVTRSRHHLRRVDPVPREMLEDVGDERTALKRCAEARLRRRISGLRRRKAPSGR